MSARSTDAPHPALVREGDVHSLDLRSAARHVTRTDPAFALTDVEIRGIRYPVFANAPANVLRMLHRARASHGGGSNTLFVYEGERLSYDRAMEEVAALARAFTTEFGVQPGDRVAIVTRNYPEMLIALMAAASVGAVAVLLNAWWTTAELEFGLSDSGARVVIADGPRLDRLRPLTAASTKTGPLKAGPLNSGMDLTLIGIRDGEGLGTHDYSALCERYRGAPLPETEIDPDADFAIMYSSGTTGAPKGVVQTHRAVVNAVWSWMIQPRLRPFMLRPGDPLPPVVRPSYLIVTPLFHVTALYPMAMLGIAVGARITLMHKWDADEAVRIMQDEAVTRFVGVPTQTADLTRSVSLSGAKLPALAYLGSGGAKRPAAHVAELARTFPGAGVGTGWGMTETCGLGIGMQGEDYVTHPDAAGRLYPPIQEIRIVGEDGRERPTGEMGEIEVKSAANMRCYYNRPDATAETLRDGWLATGDLGFIDEDGFVTIRDRKKNIIIRGGENISCAEIEEALHRHADVIEACAFSIPHERLGEVVGAALHLREGADLDHASVAAFLARDLAAFKIPERIWIRHTPLPRGTTDKTDARAVRVECLADG